MRPLHELIARPLIAAGALIASAGLLVELVHTRSHAPAVEELVPLLSLSYEGNLPTWYASSLLWTCALLLSAISADVRARRGRHDLRWLGLAVGFFAMSL